VVGTESMTRNPIAAFDHRTGFKLGSPVGFKDYMWEALKDPAAGIDIDSNGRKLGKKYSISPRRCRRVSLQSLLQKLWLRNSLDFLAGEIVPVVS